MISYAQNFEDVVLARAFGDIRDGFYVDVGACFPDFASVTRHFYDLGWSGVNVEPMEEPYRRLCDQRTRDVNLRAAIGDHNGEMAIFAGPSIGESSALRRDAAAEPIVVPCLTLAELCARHVARPVDFLKIDVEGLEFDVVRGGDWKTCRPRVVVVEVSRPWSTERRPDAGRIDAFLRDRGYREVYYDGLNAFFVADEAAALAPRLACPPNVLDRFETVREARVDALTVSLAQAEAAARHADARVTQMQAAVQSAEAAARESAARADWALACFGEAKAQIAASNRWAETAVRDLEQRLAATHARAEQAEAHSRHAQACFALIESSRSWRVTAPLREIGALWRRLRGADRAHAARRVKATGAGVLRRSLRVAKRSRIYAYAAPWVRRRFPVFWARARRTMHDAASAVVVAAPPTAPPMPAMPAFDAKPRLAPSLDVRSLSPQQIAELIEHEAARQRRN